MSCDEVFQKTPAITSYNLAAQSGDEYEDTAFQPEFETYQILNEVVKSHLFNHSWNWLHLWLRRNKLIQMCVFQFLRSSIDTRFNAVIMQIIRVWNCHVTYIRQKTGILTSIVQEFLVVYNIWTIHSLFNLFLGGDACDIGYWFKWRRRKCPS